MTLNRFGFSKSPFINVGNERGYIALPEWERVLGSLIRGVSDGQGISILTGASGSGKTMLCRELVARLDGQFLTVHLQSSGYTTRRALLQAILFELSQSFSGQTEQDSRLRLLDCIRCAAPDRQGLVLIVDEAERLNTRLLEELRSLTNQSTGGLPLVRLVLCGSLVLEESLTDPECDPINQRVVCHEILDPLTLEESARYLDRRIMRAGGDGWEHLLEQQAMEYLCRVADGSPRGLDLLADRSLHLADRLRLDRVSLESVRIAMSQLRELPLRWNEPAQASANSEPDQFDELQDVELSTRLTARSIPPDAAAEAGCFSTNIFSTDKFSTDKSSVDETACVEFGSDQNSTADQTFTFEFGSDLPVAPLHPSQNTAIQRAQETTLETTSQVASGIDPQTAPSQTARWVEFVVHDPVAALDRDFSQQSVMPRQHVSRPEQTHFAVPSPKVVETEPAIEHSAVELSAAPESNVELVIDRTESTDADITRGETSTLRLIIGEETRCNSSTTTVPDDVAQEVEILDEIISLQAAIYARTTTPGLQGDASGHNQVSDDGVAETTLAEHESHESAANIWPAIYDEVAEWDVVQPETISLCSLPSSAQTLPDPRGPKVDQVQACDPQGEEASQRPNVDVQRFIRIDAAEPRPYAQLFSRLRRRRAEAANSPDQD